MNKALKKYRAGDDTVETFLGEEGYEKSQDKFIPAKELYETYKTYCISEKMHYLTYKNFVRD